MKESSLFLRHQFLRTIAYLAVTASSIIPASAHQITLACDKAVANYLAIAEFDKQAVREGHRICGTPALRVREQVRIACPKVKQSVGKE